MTQAGLNEIILLEMYRDEMKESQKKIDYKTWLETKLIELLFIK